MKATLAFAVLLVSAELALGQYFGSPSVVTSYSNGFPQTSSYGNQFGSPYGRQLYQRNAFPVNSYSSVSSSSSYGVPQVRNVGWHEPEEPVGAWPSNGLPPLSDVSEAQLFGGVNIGDLIKPYASGESSEVNEQPVHLPDIVENQQGAQRVTDHVYPASWQTQEVVSNKLINTFTEQLKRININEQNLRRDHKAINALTKYITNISRLNHPSLLIQKLTSVQDIHKPYLYIINKKKDIINDSGHAAEAPLVVKEESNVQQLPPIINAPIIKKYSYDENPVWSQAWPERRQF